MILKKSVPLIDYCNYKIGGNAQYFYEFNSVENLTQALRKYKEVDPTLKSVFILGKGTNILFSDSGFKGLVLINSLKGISRNENIVTALSGELIEDLLKFVTKEGLSGLEWAGGLPGTVGGAVRGNAGAFGGETKDSILQVKSFNIESHKVIVRNNSECKFEYRNSVFKSEDGQKEIILSAKLEMKPGDLEEIKNKTQKKIDYRIERHPLEYPNIGSTFKNIPIEKVPEEVLENYESSIKQDPFPVLPVAKLIASTDLVGKKVGDAQISTKHPNFIVNLGNAKASDILELIGEIKKEIKKRYNISLEEEITIL